MTNKEYEKLAALINEVNALIRNVDAGTEVFKRAREETLEVQWKKMRADLKKLTDLYPNGESVSTGVVYSSEYTIVFKLGAGQVSIGLLSGTYCGRFRWENISFRQYKEFHIRALFGGFAYVFEENILPNWDSIYPVFEKNFITMVHGELARKSEIVRQNNEYAKSKIAAQ